MDEIYVIIFDFLDFLYQYGSQNGAFIKEIMCSNHYC